MEAYTLGKLIGEGTFGKVYLATSQRTAEIVAIKVSKRALKERPKGEVREIATPKTQPGRSRSTCKISPRNSLSSSEKQLKRSNSSDHEHSKHNLWKEAAIMKHLAHPNVVKLIDYIAEADREEMLVMEFMKGGDLLTAMNKYMIGGCHEAAARVLFRQLLDAVNFIHEKGYIHCDIKLENILLDRPLNAVTPPVVKLTDFGFAVTYSKTEKMLCQKGSLYYSSPEIVFCKEFYGPEADIWSLGIVVFAIVCGTMPLNFKDSAKIRDVYQELERDGLDIEKDVTEPFRDLVSKILEPDSERRITMASLLEHDWVVDKKYQFPKQIKLKIPKVPSDTPSPHITSRSAQNSPMRTSHSARNSPSRVSPKEKKDIYDAIMRVMKIT